MSPLSVAQFLKDSPIHFDLVVFDEASQMFTEDAIGAVMRGNQLVVAGDENQLPLTSFFQASQVDDSDGDEEEDDSTEQPDYESVLAVCSTFLPQKMFRWHYRSRHEGLIAFSNAREAQRIAELVVEHWRSAGRGHWRPRMSAPERRTRPWRKPSRSSCGRRGSTSSCRSAAAASGSTWAFATRRAPAANSDRRPVP